MSDPNVILTNITPPRVPLTDSRTGLISREWYRFFFNLFQLTGSGTNYASLTDLQVGPPVQQIDLTTVDPVPAGFAAYAAGSTQESQIAEIEKQLQALASTNDVNVMQSELAEIWKQLQALQLVPQFPTSPLTTGSSILYGNNSGGFSNVTIGSGVSFTSGTLSATGTGGTVTSISVVSANGLAGTSSGGATPALTLSTSVTGILKGNGTAISAAVANTDYVGVSAPVTKTADFTVANGETWFINNKSGSTCTATLPTASSWSGRSMTFKNMQAQSLVSASSNVVPIDSTSAGTAILLPVIGNWATMVSDGTNWVIMQQAPNNILLLE